MITFIKLIILFGLIGILGFFRISLKITTVIFAVSLIILTYLALWPMWLLILLWALFLLGAVVLNIPMLRRNILSAKILSIFRSSLPPMSSTEKIALEAGDVWWEGELFSGKPNWKKLLAMPKPILSKEEQTFLDNQVETLCSMLNDWEIVYENCDLPKKVWDYLKEEGFFGLVIGKQYSGLGFSAQAHSAIVSKIASRSMSVAVNVMVPNSLGPAELLHHYGTTEQKQYYLPRLAKGKDIPCFALTAPQAGSDASAIPDTGIVCHGEYQGKQIIGIKLNWDKRYITLAPIATVVGLAFKLYDPEHLLGEKEDIGITLGLIPANHPGVEIGERHLPLHLAFLNGPTRGKDVFIPLDWIIGGVEMRGKGWQMIMEGLAMGRGISLPALATAGSKLCYRMTGAYAYVRKQFKASIGRLEGVQEAMSRIGGFTYICEATRMLTASAVDQGVRPALVSAITKYHLTEFNRKVVNDAMDIHAGKAIQLGPLNYLGLVYDCIPISITVEGANILTRNLIIFGQGAMRCHPYVRHEIEAANDPDQGLKKFDNLIWKHFGYMFSNFTRTFIYGLSGGLFIHSPKSSRISRFYRQLTRMSAALAFVSDFAMVFLGGNLKRKERLSARLGDVLSYLYLASAVLKYYEQEQEPRTDLPFVCWSLDWCLASIQIAFDEFCNNFRPHWVGSLLRRIIFPWNRAYKMPRDYLSHTLAAEMMKPSLFRNRITQYSYIDTTATDGTGIVEDAFQRMVQAEPTKIKLQNAIRTGRVPRDGSLEEQTQVALKAGIITEDESRLLKDYQKIQLAAIAVDEFNPSTFARKRTNGRSKTKINNEVES